MPKSAYDPILGESFSSTRRKFQFRIGRTSVVVENSQYKLGVGSTYGVAKGGLFMIQKWNV